MISKYLLYILIFLCFWVNYPVFAQKSNDINQIQVLVEEVKQNPNNAELYLRLGKMYYHLDDYEKAMTQFWEVLRLIPKSDKAYLWLGKCYIRRGFSVRGLKQINESLKINPSNWEVYLFLGDYEFQSGNIKKA